MENLGATSAGGFAALAAHVGCRTSQWRRAVASGTASWFAMEPIWNRHGTVCLCYMDLGSVAWEYYGILLQWCDDVPRIVWWRFGSRHGIYSCLRLLYMPNKIIKDWNVFCRFLSPHWGFQCGIRKVTSGSQWEELKGNSSKPVAHSFGNVFVWFCLLDISCSIVPVGMFMERLKQRLPENLVEVDWCWCWLVLAFRKRNGNKLGAAGIQRAGRPLPVTSIKKRTRTESQEDSHEQWTCSS